MNALIYLLHIARLSNQLLDLSAIPSNMGDEPRADISAKWEFERFEGLITRNPHRPQELLQRDFSHFSNDHKSISSRLSTSILFAAKISEI